MPALRTGVQQSTRFPPSTPLQPGTRLQQRTGLQWTRSVRDRPHSDRWLALGRSEDPNSRRAGHYAAARAMVGTDPALLIVFCSGIPDPSGVLAGVGEVAGGVPLIGCSAEALIALGGEGFSVRTEARVGVRGRQRTVGAEVARCAVPPPERASQALLMLADGDAGSQDAILAGAYSVVGAGVPLVGGAASPYPGASTMFTMHNGEVLADAVVAASLGSDGPIGIGVRHGFHKVGEPMIVTRSAGGLVHTLDDRPALDMYLRRLGAPLDAYRSQAIFEDFSRGHPIGVRRRTSLELRDVSYSEHMDDRCLFSAGDVPEGGMIWLMATDEESSLAAGEQAGVAAIEALGGVEPLGLLAFDCASRCGFLGLAGMHKELGRLTAAVAGAPIAGFYTYGEYARVRGAFGYHNQTLAVGGRRGGAPPGPPGAGPRLRASTGPESRILPFDAGGRHDGAAGEYAGEVLAVLGRAGQVAGRVGTLGRVRGGGRDRLGGGRRAGERLFDGPGPHRYRPHVRERDAGGGDRTVLPPYRRGHAHRRPGLRDPVELLVVGAPALPLAQAYREQHIVRAERTGQVVHEELRRGYRAGATRPGHLEAGVQREGHRRQVAGRVGVGERAAEGTPVAHLAVGDGRDGLREQWRVPADERVTQHRRVRRHRPDHQVVAVLTDPAQRVQPAQVDQYRRGGQPQAQQRDQALPAGEYLRVLTGGGERLDRLVHSGRSYVVECRGDHEAPPADWMARQTRSGVQGICTSVTPYGRSASTTAFTTAGVDAMVPASPTPLVPRGWSGAGVSVRSVIRSGRSAAVGRV
jgi:hypothetical protein